ncbi:hypothetical protein EIN_381060 [Entamoeba invadens IP1]|uniref:Tetraspanin-6 n=1 Tax=Entamoeba invadens IP1 TaxID=370355 RepID=A0A0A1UG19_ENTIV|nr:hypothetical protein EIN_381060 [Entamoeba invadens IP1]ELP92149.1 hypothetical protein EIN_381060 [Entamoeba invadens IP1]|eukprot:XP_004258920.1 hypothetical protein EIN_381060 [Entamoeba invadens IP1]
MWKISRILIVVVSSLVTLMSLVILGVTIFAIVHYKNRYTFVPWNIMVMTILTGITGAITFITGLVSITGGILQRKIFTMATVVMLIFSTAIVTFIGLYSLSGVISTEKTLERGWSEMGTDEDKIRQFEEVWGCHNFNEKIPVVNVTETSISSNDLPYCSEVLKTPFLRYSGVMLGLSLIVYFLLIGMQIIVSFHVSKDDKPAKLGFEPIDKELGTVPFQQETPQNQ